MTGGVMSWHDLALYLIAGYMSPVAVTTGSSLSRRTLERRFRKATGRSPIFYVQQLRIREARRLFQRTTRLHPGSYRRKFGVGQVR